MRIIRHGGNGALSAAGRIFIDVVGAVIRHKKVTRVVEGDSERIIQPGGEGALTSTGSEFIDDVGASSLRRICFVRRRVALDNCESDQRTCKSYE